MFPLLSGISIFCIANPGSKLFQNLFGTLKHTSHEGVDSAF